MKQTIKSKAKLLQQVQDKSLLAEKPPLFKRQLYRLYTRQGKKARKLPQTRICYELDELTGMYVPIKKETIRRYRGNYLAYVERTKSVMKDIDGGAIKRQIRRHERVFRDYLNEKIGSW